MGTFDKIMKLVSDSIKMEGRVSALTDEVKLLAKELREIDKRLVRVETYIEIASKTKQLK